VINPEVEGRERGVEMTSGREREGGSEGHSHGRLGIFGSARASSVEEASK